MFGKSIHEILLKLTINNVLRDLRVYFSAHSALWLFTKAEGFFLNPQLIICALFKSEGLIFCSLFYKFIPLHQQLPHILFQKHPIRQPTQHS